MGIHIIRRPPIAEDFRITKEVDIAKILKTTSNGVDLSRRYDVIQFNSAVQPGIRFTVDTAKLIRHIDSSGNLFAQMNVNQFKAAIVANENNIQNFITVEPYGTAVQNTAWQQLAMHIFHEIGRPGKSLALASRSVDMIQRQVGEQHRFFERFREDSDNHWGAAMATMIVMKHKDIRDTISAGNDTEVRNNLLTEERRKRLVAGITQARALTYSPIFSWQVADQTRTNLPAAMAVIPLGGPMPPLGGQVYNVPIAPTAEDRRQAIAWANERMREANQVITESQRVATNFVTIGTIIRDLHPGSALPILTYVNWIPPPPSVPPALFPMYDRSLNLSVLLDAIVSDTNLQLKTEQHHQTQIDTLNESLKKIADGEVPKGADAQFKVLSAELIRYHGLTEDEASRGANVLRARSLIDTDMSQVSDRIVERMWRT